MSIPGNGGLRVQRIEFVWFHAPICILIRKFYRLLWQSGSLGSCITIQRTSQCKGECVPFFFAHSPCLHISRASGSPVYGVNFGIQTFCHTLAIACYLKRARHWLSFCLYVPLAPSLIISCKILKLTG